MNSFHLDSFDKGEYQKAVEEENLAKLLVEVLYPNDNHMAGKELRLKQQYFFISASVQRAVAKYKETHKDVRKFYEKATFQLNDTHPTVAVAELMRVLIDEEHLEWDEEVRKKYPIDMSGIAEESCETEIISQKYDFIEEIIEECLVGKSQKAEFTDKIDGVLTNRIWGVPIFLGIMALVFFLTFAIGDWLKGYMEQGIDWLAAGVGQWLAAWQVGSVMESLVIDGIIGGVGTIVTFLPNIFILFLALAFWKTAVIWRAWPM